MGFGAKNPEISQSESDECGQGVKKPIYGTGRQVQNIRPKPYAANIKSDSSPADDQKARELVHRFMSRLVKMWADERPPKHDRDKYNEGKYIGAAMAISIDRPYPISVVFNTL